MGKKSKTKIKFENKSSFFKETLENGLTFEGEIRAGEWHGHGILSHPEGFRYEGAKNAVCKFFECGSIEFLFSKPQLSTSMFFRWER